MALLETSTSEGALKGMVLARAPHELGDQEVAYLQDAILNQPGFVSRRGAITGTTAITSANLDASIPIQAIVTTDPSGVQKIGFLYLKDNGASGYELWLSVYTTAFVFVQKHFLMQAAWIVAGLYPGRTAFVQCTPAIDGSVIISMRNTYSRALGISGFPSANARIIKWHGGCPTTTKVGTLQTATLTTTEGSTTVTGAAAEIAKISFPGTVVRDIGIVSSVTSTTAVELVHPSPTTNAAVAIPWDVIENLAVARARGRVSCAAGVLAGMTGYGTKFTEADDLATNANLAGIGFSFLDPANMLQLAAYTGGFTVQAPSDTVTIAPTTVYRSAALKHYLRYCFPGSAGLQPNYSRFSNPSQSTHTPKSVKGSWFANYKGYMISFNGLVESPPVVGWYPGDVVTTGRAYIHGPRFPEIMDHSSADGDWFEVPTNKAGDQDGVAISAGSNAVVLCKSQESFVLTGDDPESFTLNKCADDGALTFESVASWKGMPLWLGRTGIWMWDGQQAVNIIEDTIGVRWKEITAIFDGRAYAAQDANKHMTHQARCFVYKDHLFVNVTYTNTYGIYTDGVQRASLCPMQLMIYLPTMACTFLTNMNWQCNFQIGTQGYMVLPQDGSTTHHIFPIDNLFTQGLATTDTILTANSYNSGTLSTSVGPWFHMESRKYALGDGLRRKTWKQLSIEYLFTNTKRVFLETVPGLNTTGTRQVTPYVGTGVFKAFKNKFNARDQYMSFRLYEDINNRPATLKLGAWQWAYKLARRGQV